MKQKHVRVNNNYNFSYCRLLGKGHNGEVYKLPSGEAIKVSYNDYAFVGECNILERVNGNRYFPEVYQVGKDYIIRECADGEVLSKYIRKNGMSEELACRIIDLLKEFYKLKFKKIDIRCRDIIVQPDGQLKVIDPKKCYSRERDFPRHLSKGLYKLGVLDFFIEVLKGYDEKLYKMWSGKINRYIESKKKIM